MSRWGAGVDPTAMRCPRCLSPWDPDWVDLGGENATCRPCEHVVALLGMVLPEIERDDVVSRLDAGGKTPALGELVLSEVGKPKGVSVRTTGSFFASGVSLALDASGVRQSRRFRKPVSLPLAGIRRVVPASVFEWERDSRQDLKRLLAVVRIVAIPRVDGPAPAIDAPSWEAARFVASRFERTRRALTETGIYR